IVPRRRKITTLHGHGGKSLNAVILPVRCEIGGRTEQGDIRTTGDDGINYAFIVAGAQYLYWHIQPLAQPLGQWLIFLDKLVDVLHWHRSDAQSSLAAVRSVSQNNGSLQRQQKHQTTQQDSHSALTLVAWKPRSNSATCSAGMGRLK